VFELVGKWLQTPGRAVLCVVHDLSLALAYGTCAVLLKEGRVMDRGVPKKVLSRENLLSTYDMDVAAWSRRMLGQWNDM
jgi:ABC-type cobalamin/Fe3+-siderophores transport system ATPase subunit